MKRARGTLLTAVAVVVIVGGACGSARPEAGSVGDGCADGGAALTPQSAASALAGSYRLSLAVASGPRAGGSAEGQLVLRPGDQSTAPAAVLGLRDSTVRHPLVGSLELDPAAAGAAATGDLASADPAAPGVLVIERRPVRPDAAVEITLRLGAEANRRDVLRFDGGYFALTVRRLGARGFAGTWASGGADGVAGTAGGSFCARRAAG
jgi:hypothetical protein